MKKSKEQEELEQGLELGKEGEPQQEVVDEPEEVIEDDEELRKEEEPQVPVAEQPSQVQKGLALQSAPTQFEIVDRETGEAVLYSTNEQTLPLEIAIKTLEYAREAAINSRQ